LSDQGGQCVSDVFMFVVQGLEFLFGEGVEGSANDGADACGAAQDGCFDRSGGGDLSAVYGAFFEEDVGCAVEVCVDDFGADVDVALDPGGDVGQVACGELVGDFQGSLFFSEDATVGVEAAAAVNGGSFDGATHGDIAAAAYGEEVFDVAADKHFAAVADVSCCEVDVSLDVQDGVDFQLWSGEAGFAVALCFEGAGVLSEVYVSSGFELVLRSGLWGDLSSQDVLAGLALGGRVELAEDVALFDDDEVGDAVVAAAVQFFLLGEGFLVLLGVTRLVPFEVAVLSWYGGGALQEQDRFAVGLVREGLDQRSNIGGCLLVERHATFAECVQDLVGVDGEVRCVCGQLEKRLHAVGGYLNLPRHVDPCIALGVLSVSWQQRCRRLSDSTALFSFIGRSGGAIYRTGRALSWGVSWGGLVPITVRVCSWWATWAPDRQRSHKYLFCMELSWWWLVRGVVVLRGSNMAGWVRGRGGAGVCGGGL